jgi:hypothetical protein
MPTSVALLASYVPARRATRSNEAYDSATMSSSLRSTHTATPPSGAATTKHTTSV